MFSVCYYVHVASDGFLIITASFHVQNCAFGHVHCFVGVIIALRRCISAVCMGGGAEQKAV